MKFVRKPILATLCMLIALPLAGQVAGFSGADDDGDGLPDDFEQAVLEKFKPTWKISPTDCNIQPAEFVPDILNPTVKDQNGTIYGQVFIRGSNALGFFVEAHFYDLWAADCGYINSHLLDAEHVSVLIRAIDSSQPLSEWHATQWYAAAHEDTLCDSSQFAQAAPIDAEDKGATFWIARGKHGAFFSPQVCKIGGCGLDRCEASTADLSPSPLNIGELNAPLNGAVWTSSGRWPLAAKMRTDFPAFSVFSSLSYSVATNGGLSFSTGGTPVNTGIGYASIQSTDTAPAGVSIFSVRRGNVLVTEAAVPSSAPIPAGRFYAEVAGRVKTGVAIVNPSNQPAQISFYFTDAGGRSFGFNNISIPPKGLVGRFLDESPFNSGSFGRGTFTFVSSVPVGVLALCEYRNERNEYLITTLPVSPLNAPGTSEAVFPHVADGGGWTTEFVLVNPTDAVLSGTIEFLGQGTGDSPADPLEIKLNEQVGSTFTYTIPPRSSWVGTTGGSDPVTQVGSVHVIPAESNATPSGVAIFALRRGGTLLTQTGVGMMPAGSAFHLFVESSANFDAAEPGSLQTGIAIANVSAIPATLSLVLTNLSGSPVGIPSNLTVPPRGQAAMFLNQLPGFSELPSSFQGVLRISVNSRATVSVIGLRGRYNERRDFLLATTPAISEDVPAIVGDSLFPYLADGGGYSTQFILLSPEDASSSSGWLRFYTPSGSPMNLLLK